MANPYYAALTAGPSGKRGRYTQLAAALTSTRDSGFKAVYQDVTSYLLPRRTRFWTGDRNKGDRRNQLIIDSTAKFSHRTLSAGMHSGLTSPARPWMKLSVPDKTLARRRNVKAWLQQVTELMLAVFAQTNFYNCAPTVYGDMSGFGTAAVGALPDARDLFRCYTYPVGSYALATDKRGLVDTFYLEYERSVAQVVREFGVQPGSTVIDWSGISTRVRNLWERGNYQEAVTIGWLVQPNENQQRDRLLAVDRMPFTSCHWELETQEATPEDKTKFLRESGFENFPILAPRWDVTGGDDYGTECPAFDALGDIRQLQGEQRRKGQLLAKIVDPPLVAGPEMRTQKTSLVSGDVTYAAMGREGRPSVAPIHELRLEGFQHLTADIEDVRFLIRRAFYEDLFLTLARSPRIGQPPTAREIEEIHEEKLLALGPTVERTDDEFLNPLVDLTYDGMDRAGMIPEPPPEIEGVQLGVEYTSYLAEAQKLIGIVGQDRFSQSVMTLAEIWPEARHKVKPFVMVDTYSDLTGSNPEQLRSDEEAQELYDQEMQQQAAALAAQQARDLGGAVNAAGAKPIAADSGLDRLLSAAGAQPAAGAV